jgi:hypothetical protein
VQIRHAQTVRDRLRRNASAVFDATKPFLGDVGGDAAIHHQRGAAVVADVNTEHVHRRRSIAISC